MFRTIASVVVVACLVAFLSAPSFAQSRETIGGIRVEGNQRIEAETVLSYLTLAPGDPFDQNRLDQSLKDLFRTGLFADVILRREGTELVVQVVENPVINRIAFEGNRRITDEILNAEVQLRPRVVYTRTRVQSDVKRLLEIYRRSGRFAARIEPKVIQLPQNRVDLVFEIEEGELTRIRRIVFVGNRRFSDGALREVIRTAETRWYRVFSSNDIYDPDRLTFDQELLRQFYLKNGYADFRVISSVAELTRDAGGFIITFAMEEGERYRFADIDIESRIEDADPEQLRSIVTTSAGDWYDASAVDESIEAMTSALGNLGYAFVDIRPRVDVDREARTISVVYEIEEAPRVYVERIDIFGNDRTLDEVLRREFRLAEGDAYNAAKIRRSRKEIRDLGFFESVEVRRVPGSSPDRTVIEAEVKEKSTGELSFGAGFSTDQGVLGTASIRERNLLGRAQDLSLSLNISGVRQQVDLGFTEPYFLGRKLAAGFDLFNRADDFQDESSFDREATGGVLRLGYPLSDRLSQGLSYTLRRDEVLNVGSDASRFIKEQQGERISSIVGQVLTHDTLDSRIEPTSGHLARIRTEYAGVGGDTQFGRVALEGRQYYSVVPGWVLSVDGEVGIIDGLGEPVRITDRFYLGGANLRGFEFAGVGPRDAETNDALGGNMFYTGTVQLDFPSGLPKELGVRGSVFVDAGTLTDVDATDVSVIDSGAIRLSVGVGISWVSPFGPVRIDIAEAVAREPLDQTEIFRFSFGTRF